MTTNKNNPHKSDPNQAEEPETAYGEKRITFFDSFEEMNEYDLRSYAKMTPEERLHTVYIMRKAYQTESTTEKPFGKHIYFK